MDKKKLLVVVDMQQDFVTGALGTKEAVSIVGKVAKKIDEMKETDTVMYTMDTHFDDYLETQEGKYLPVTHCICLSDGYELVPEIKSAIKRFSRFDRCYRVEKYTFGSVTLADYTAIRYKRHEFDEVEFVGVCTDVCVISNALLIKAFCPELPITVDASCCAGTTPESHKTALQAMKACQINIINEE